MTTPSAQREFPVTSARSASLVAGLCIAILVESIALHALLSKRHPLLDVVLVVTSLASACWLVADYRAIAARPITLGATELVLRRGFQRLIVPTSDIERVAEPSWKEIPETGAGDYLSLAGPSGPNVLLELKSPAALRLPIGITRRARRIGLRLDDAPSFVNAVREIASPSIS